MIGLFKSVDDRQETRLAYQASYFPIERIRRKVHKIVWDRFYCLRPEEFELLCNAELTLVQLPKTDKLPQEFAIHWEYNCIPTEEEWNRIVRNGTMISINYRISPLIKDCDGRVALMRTMHHPMRIHEIENMEAVQYL